MKYPFSEAEMEIKSHRKFGNMEIVRFNYPVTPKEGAKAAYSGHPLWQSAFGDMQYTAFRSVPDNIARAFVSDGTGRLNPDEMGGKDMFGIDWVYVPAVGGSMVKGGNPVLEDANDWKEVIHFPDIETWDWEKDVEANHAFFTDRLNLPIFFTGWFERLISFMDFSEAAVALIDEEQQDAVKELFDKLTDLYIKIYDKLISLYPEIEVVMVHDDWGSQRAPLFSPDTAMEMLVPAHRKFTDHVHATGRLCEIHSCGYNIDLTEAYIAAGWDVWNPQTINDTGAIYDKYGDRIIIGVCAPEFDENTSEEELRAAAREYAEKYCNPDKPSILNCGSYPPIAFMEELYRESRKRYDK